MKRLIVITLFTLTLLLANYGTSYGQWSLTQTKGLSFGSIAPGTNVGTVTVDDTGGKPTTTGGVHVFLDYGHCAEFRIRYTGAISFMNSVSVEAPVIIDGHLRITEFTVHGSYSGYMGWFRPTRDFSVGATLEIKPTAAVGYYSAPFYVTINHN